MPNLRKLAREKIEEERKQIEKFVQEVKANASDSFDLSHRKFENCDFSNVDFKNIRLYFTRFIDCNLINISMEDRIILFCSFINCNFKDAKLLKINFRKCSFIKCNFDNTNMKDTFNERSCFEENDFSRAVCCDFDEIDLNNWLM